MLSVKDEVVSLLDEVEAGVVPSREVTAATKLLSEPGRRGFAQVMDQEHGEVEVPLERAQRTEDAGDLLRGILIQGHNSHKWIEDEEAGTKLGNGAAQEL